MFRLVVIVAAFFASAQPTGEGSRRDIAVRPAAEASRLTKEIGDIVRGRFQLGARAAACGHTDNLYAYNLLLSTLAESQKHFIVEAARDGGRDGTAIDPDACAAVLRDLRAADDRLIVQSERVAQEKAAF